METASLILLIFTTISSLVAAIASMISAFQKKMIDSLSLDLKKAKEYEYSSKKELYKAYINLNELLKIEEELSNKLGIDKPTTRKNRSTDRYAQPKHVTTRVRDLYLELQNFNK